MSTGPRTKAARTPFILFLFFLVLLANLSVPWLLKDSALERVLIVRGMVGGGVVAEICLVAIWAALGPQPFVNRVPFTFALLSLAYCAFMVGQQFPDASIFSLEDAASIGLGAVVIFTGVQVPLLIVRSWDHRRIASRDTRYLTAEEESLQFGMRHLLSWMSAIAFMLVVVRHSLGDTSFQRSTNRMLADLPAILGGMLMFAFLSALICLPCIRLALGFRFAARRLVWLIFVFLASPPCVIGVVMMFDGRLRGADRVLIGLYSTLLGLALSLLVVLLGLRRLGFRLVSDERVWPAA